MNIDQANLLLVQYDDGKLFLVSSSFFSQEQFFPFDTPEIGTMENGLLKITLKVAVDDSPASTVPTEELLQPAVHIVQLNNSIPIINNNGETEIDGEIEVTVLMGSADDPDSFTNNLRSLKPSRVKKVSVGGDARPVEE